jgi:hypothetical protein
MMFGVLCTMYHGRCLFVVCSLSVRLFSLGFRGGSLKIRKMIPFVNELGDIESVDEHWTDCLKFGIQ